MPERFARFYVGAWLLACVVALVLAAQRQREFRLLTRAYARSLLVPWKLATFATACVGMVLVAPISGDPTWDAVDGGGMSLLCYLTAPWALGVLTRAIARLEKPRPVELYGAVCAWMFTASWFYDGWIWYRDGHYPSSWAANILASSFLYALGGTLWSLEDGERWPTLGFLHPDWPRPSAASRRVAWAALGIIVAVLLMLSPFLAMAWQTLFGR